MSLDNTKLANTIARSAASMTIAVTNKEGGTPVTIGAVESVSRRIDRTSNVRRRELDSNVPGQCVEIIPGPSTITLTLKRAVLYNNTMMEALGLGSIEDLIENNIPIQLIETRNNPGATPSAQVITYHGAIPTNNPFDYDLTRDWTVMQDVTFDVAYITITNPQSPSTDATTTGQQAV